MSAALAADTPPRAASPAAFARLLKSPRALVMGVLNVTPDSFSDGGRFLEPGRAIEQARRMTAEGADILDIGAESSRPYGGMQPIGADEECARLAAILPAVVGLGPPVSIDTMKAAVASWAIGQGAAMVNDVWGLQRDPDMAGLVARHRVPVVIMHNRDTADPSIDIMADIGAFLRRSLAIAERAGIARELIVIDPGIGFGKTPEQSIEVLGKLPMLREFGLPILVGASRKRFIASVVPSEPAQRIGGSLASHLLAVQAGAKIIRAHDVAETVQALRVAGAIEAAR